MSEREVYMARKRSDSITKNCESIIQKSIYRKQILCIDRVKTHLNGIPLAEFQYYLKKYKKDTFTKLMKGVYLKTTYPKTIYEYIDVLMSALGKRYYMWPLQVNKTYIVVIEGKNKLIRPIVYNDNCTIRFVQTTSIQEKFVKRIKYKKTLFNTINLPALFLDYVKYAYWLKEDTIKCMRDLFITLGFSYGLEFLKEIGISQNSHIKEEIIEIYTASAYRILLEYEIYFKNDIISIHLLKLTLACIELMMNSESHLLREQFLRILDIKEIKNLKNSIYESPSTKFTITQVSDDFLKRWNLCR